MSIFRQGRRKEIVTKPYRLPAGIVAACLVVATLFLFLAPRAGAFNRWVDVDGARNFRDAGGYDVTTTQSVARGMVYRSDALAWLTQSDAQLLEDLGLTLVVDLRTTGETLNAPDSAFLDPFTTHVYAPINFIPGIWESMIDEYRGTFHAHQHNWRKVFELLTDPGNYPLNYHCAAGKDRTGMMTAQLLTLLGVDRETVIEDYMLSNRVGQYVEREWIEAVLDDIETSGGIELYLQGIGVDADEQKAIRGILVVPRPTRARNWMFY